ncbi:MAG TPA: helix-turn-helix transcriptional regulator [Gemmataceae bacterium]|jgi:transcriptional regulator with XRE-family HTH domain|nr:helix-turn-helix transcriptional regulator [Gemmataceae bacterium]
MVATEFLEQLRQRREQLGMPLAVLAAKAGVPMQTLHRILHGEASAHFDKVLAVAQALEVVLSAQKVKAREVRKRQARATAKRLVGMVQGTSGLEGQALDRDTLEEMTEQTTHQLLASKYKLWSL